MAISCKFAMWILLDFCLNAQYYWLWIVSIIMNIYSSMRFFLQLLVWLEIRNAHQLLLHIYLYDCIWHFCWILQNVALNFQFNALCSFMCRHSLWAALVKADRQVIRGRGVEWRECAGNVRRSYGLEVGLRFKLIHGTHAMQRHHSEG